MAACELDESARIRLCQWKACGNFVSIGNLGEQITLTLLRSWGYEVLATQDDLLGGVSNIFEEFTRIQPEDFIAIDVRGRLVTVNSKATISKRTCRLTTSETLTPPRMRGQSSLSYYSSRANLIDSLDGGLSFGQVVKVDLMNLKAQLFEILDDGRLSASGRAVDVVDHVHRVMAIHPGNIPAPSAHDD